VPPVSVALALALILMTSSTPSSGATPDARPRLRDLGVTPGIFPPGPLNAITDVAGVRVGHRTIVEGDSIRTGVTAILPHGGNIFRMKVPAGVFTGNGFGKAAGFLQVQELGQIETPIVLTNTLAVGTAIDAVVAWTLEQPGNQDVRSVNAVVGETNDGHLNDVRARRVTQADVRAAIDAAAAGPVAMGSVGAGTGTRALGWKGGIGTASRKLPASRGGWTVGALVQSNFGGVLSVDGLSVGKRLGRHDFRDDVQPSGLAGSCMIVLATDAPLTAKALERVAARGVLGLARTGGYMADGSGDFVIAFSTANQEPHAPEPESAPRRLEALPHEGLSPIFLAAVEAVEEAVLDSLIQARTVTGHMGRTAESIPLDRLREMLGARGRTAPPPRPRKNPDGRD
jgi:D-aminopeptidase